MGDPSPADTIVRRSRLAADADAVWAHATSLEGINAELGPWLRMTAPPGIADISADPPLGEFWFHSWILVLGLFPYDRMHLRITALEHRRFVEQSTMLWLKGWRHERLVEPVEGGCVIEDRLTPQPRIPGSMPVVRFIIGRLFDHRHSRLRKEFGS